MLDPALRPKCHRTRKSPVEFTPHLTLSQMFCSLSPAEIEQEAAHLPNHETSSDKECCAIVWGSGWHASSGVHARTPRRQNTGDGVNLAHMTPPQTRARTPGKRYNKLVGTRRSRNTCAAAQPCSTWTPALESEMSSYGTRKIHLGFLITCIKTHQNWPIHNISVPSLQS